MPATRAGLPFDLQMAVSGPPPPSTWSVSSVTVFKVIQADRQGRLWVRVTPGWHKRVTSAEGVISLLPMRRWRLWRHRALWGFSGLVDGR